MDGTCSPDMLTKWLALVVTPLSDIATSHTNFYRVLYPGLRLAYETAGCPYGSGEEDMWRWWQERAAVERAEWLARHSQTSHRQSS